MHRVRAYALMQQGKLERAGEALRVGLDVARWADETFELALTLEACARLAELRGEDTSESAKESKALLARLGVVSMLLGPARAKEAKGVSDLATHLDLAGLGQRARRGSRPAGDRLKRETRAASPCQPHGVSPQPGRLRAHLRRQPSCRCRAARSSTRTTSRRRGAGPLLASDRPVAPWGTTQSAVQPEQRVSMSFFRVEPARSACPRSRCSNRDGRIRTAGLLLPKQAR